MHSPNHDHRPSGAAIDMLVLHYTGMQSGSLARSRLCDPSAKVSAHYMIDEDGAIDPLVPERRRAWHAGLSCWRQQRALNDVSIGIELVNPGHEWGYRGFPEPQMAALITLASGIQQRWSIPPFRILGHSDIAPTRKQDPGELFDWHRLAEHGLGLMPTTITPEPASAKTARGWLADIGYDLQDAGEAAVILAFQRHFCPAQLGNGLTDMTMGAIIACHRLFSSDQDQPVFKPSELD